MHGCIARKQAAVNEKMQNLAVLSKNKTRRTVIFLQEEESSAGMGRP